jgi:hypothetical protein
MESMNESGPAPAGSPSDTLQSCFYTYDETLTPWFSSVGPAVVGNTTDGAATLRLKGNTLDALPELFDIVIGEGKCSNVVVDAESLNCTLPELPAGKQPLRVIVDGMGYALMPNQDSTMNLTYTMAITPASAPMTVALWGGAVIQLQGYGFLPSGVANSSDTPSITTNSSSSKSSSTIKQIMSASVVCSSAGIVSPQTVLLNATATSIWIRLERFGGSSTANTAQLTIRLSILDTSDNSTTTADAAIRLDAAVTPRVSLPTAPITVAPYTSSALNFTWAVPQSSINLTASAVEAASNIRAYLVPGDSRAGTIPAAFDCSSATVWNSSVNSTHYLEGVICSIPDSLPSSNYSLWVCLEPYGCGFRSGALLVSCSKSS